MRKRVRILVPLLILAVFVAGMANQKGEKGKESAMLEKIHWLGHASFRIDGPKVIYIDPWKLPQSTLSKKADMILVTHSHFDHFSKEDIEKIRTNNTVLFLSRDVAGKMKGNVISMEPGKKVEKDGITVEAVPAYNPNKKFHPKKEGWMGYIVTVGGVRIYHAGDTDFIPEMKELKNIDIALLPIGGTYTMDAKEAAEAANAFKPAVVIPMHWGDIIGSEKDVETFKKLFHGKTHVLKPER